VSAPLRRALLAAAPARGQLFLAVALQVATVGAGIGLMGSSAWLISTAALHPSIAALSVAIVGVRFFGLARGVSRYLERVVSHGATLDVLARLRERVYRALEPLAPARLMDRRSGDLLVRLVDDVDTLEHVYVRILGPSLSAGLAAMLAALVLGARAPGLAVAALTGLAFAGVLVPWLAARMGEVPGRRAVAVRAALSARLVDAVQGVADVLAFGAARRYSDVLDRDSRTLAALQQRASNIAGAAGALAALAADLTAVGAVVLGVMFARAGHLDGVQVAVVVLVTLASFEAVAGLPAAHQATGATREAARRLFELTDARPEVVLPLSPVAPPKVARFEVRGLTFRYPGTALDVLHDLDLTVERGQLVAVVGPSGSGKSTLASLLLRFWDVAAGSLIADGTDIRRFHPDAWRTRVAFAQQQAHLFTGTLRENLRVGNRLASEDALNRAIGRAGLTTLVSSLPEGLDTWIGEQGLQLSGGERQRLALARVLLSEAPLVVLDEPTAHVDALTERDLLGEIARLAADRAVLLITHRLVGLERADEVIVLDGGRSIERGRYPDLVHRGGWFAQMLDLQRSMGVLERA
jgi:ATP-binding cassette subfamily C protein CydC